MQVEFGECVEFIESIKSIEFREFSQRFLPDLLPQRSFKSFLGGCRRTTSSKLHPMPQESSLLRGQCRGIPLLPRGDRHVEGKCRDVTVTCSGCGFRISDRLRRVAPWADSNRLYPHTKNPKSTINNSSPKQQSTNLPLLHHS
jgi:hypothetical protein